MSIMDADKARVISDHLRDAGFTENNGQVLMLAEETGEFVNAYRRYAGLARRTGTFAEVSAELADVIIGAWVVGEFLGVDLDRAISDKLEVIMTRGWRDPR